MSGYNGGAFILLLVLASPSNKALVCVETPWLCACAWCVWLIWRNLIKCEVFRVVFRE